MSFLLFLKVPHPVRYISGGIGLVRLACWYTAKEYRKPLPRNPTEKHLY